MSARLSALRRAALRPALTAAGLGVGAAVLTGAAGIGAETARGDVAGSPVAPVTSAAFELMAADTAGGRTRRDPLLSRSMSGRGGDGTVERRASSTSASRSPVRRPALTPVEAELPIASYEVTGTFGAAGGLWSSSHTGLDFAAPYGSTVAAVQAGKVTSVGHDGAFGLTVVVRADDGTHWWFCHLGEVAVALGDRVTPGDTIGSIGMTGNTTGPHLHLEAHRGGRPVDPWGVLRDLGLRP